MFPQVKKNCIFVLVICFFGSIGLPRLTYAQGKTVDIHSLHLYKMLNDFREVIAQQTLAASLNENKEASVQKKLLSPLELVEDAIKKLHEIVEIFNKDDFYAQVNQYKKLEIQYKFVNACNFIEKDVEKNGGKVERRHLRDLRNKFVEFDQIINDFCLREKNFLNQQEIAAFNKITQFNQILLTHLLNNEYLKNDFADKFIDGIFYRPMEVVCEHPWATLALLATTAFLVWNYYYVPYVQLKNRNADVEVTQFRVRNQWRHTCGLHSVYNLMCFMHGKNDDEVRQLLSDGNAFDMAQQTCMRVNGTDNDLHGDHVQHLLQAYNVPVAAQANTTVIDDPGVLPQLANLTPEISAILAAVPGLEDLQGKRQRFNAANSQPQYFVVNSNGHWNPFEFIRDAAVQGGVRVRTADSSWNINVTQHPAINQIAHFLRANPPVAPVH